MKEIRQAPKLKRAALPMLSVPVEYAACPTQLTTTHGLACGARPAGAEAEWSEIAGKIASAVEGTADPDALHAAALLDLLNGAAGNSLDRSISYLEMTSRIAPTADRFVDLSAAYLARAERDDDARSTVAALDAAAHATQMDSANAAARFNLGIALRELGLFGSARAELESFIALDPETPWADEARRYKAALAIDTVVAPSDTTITPDSMAAFARAHPNESRFFSWDRLASWSRAYLSGDSLGAERHLRLAEAAGKAIVEHHVDPSISDAVSAIRDAGIPARRRLAAAHGAYAEGQALSASGRSADAEKAFISALTIGRGSPSLAAWATYAAGHIRLALNDPPGAESAIRRVLDSPAARRYPELAARAHWTLGVILLRNRRFEEATRSTTAARDLYELLGEREFQANMIGQLGENANLAGYSRESYAQFTRALHMLRNYPLSNWRHNILFVMSRAAAADGYPAAAAFVDREDDAASRAANRLPSLVETQLTRARTSLTRGDSAAGAHAVLEGRRLAAKLPAGNIRSQLQSDLAIEAANLAARDRLNAMAALDTAIAYFTQISNTSKLLRAYAARAALFVNAGDGARAEADLDRALTIYEQQRGRVADATQRSLLSQQARRVGDALAMLRVSRGDARGALAARERAREAGLRLLPGRIEGRVTIELALLGDTLVTFVAREDSVTVHQAAGEGAGLRSDIDLATVALERRAPERVWRPLLERMYDRLIRPVAGQLSASDSVLTIIADGTLSGVPFAALRDSTDGSYLIDHYALRFAPSLLDANAHAMPLPKTPRALLVAEPSLDKRAYPSLVRLPAAAGEVDSIATFLREPRILRGTDVDTARLKRAMLSADIFHFAGHAVFDDARPYRSQLAVGSRGLTATSIAGMSLKSLRLVVLSACETNRAPAGVGTGFLGLTESFIAAGAGGVIGSLWKVDDEPTGTLMQSFYRALERTRDPVLALRDAQRAMRAQPPTAWGAFKYVGR